MNNKQTLKEYLYEHLATQSADNYLYTIENFLKLHPKAKRYKYKQMLEYMVEVGEKYKNIQTRCRIMSAIKRYYDYLVWTGQRADHPCKTLNLKREAEKSIQLQDLFTSQELELLLQRVNRYRHLENRNKVLISLLIYQGLTSDELIRLDVDNIDLDAGTVYVKGSNKLNRRTLRLESVQILLFDRYINQTRGEMMKRLKNRTGKLILNKLGQPISVEGIFSVIEVLNPLFPDKRLNPRTIRMSVISNWMNEKKLALESVQLLAGHKWPSTTEKYRKMDNLKQRELINSYFPI